MFKAKTVEILNLIVKNGLYTYKQKNSKATLPELVEAAKEDKKDIKGAVFAVRDKSNFLEDKVKGYIVTSKETLFEDYNQLTHWTPNTFRKFKYSDEEKRFISGFEEQNLGQINTFVIDIDTKQYALSEILMTCIDESVGVPTFIIESERGYQLYFVLEKAIFISSKNEYRILKMAKRVSENLKRSLAGIQADYYCNDFGFFRIPTDSNVVHASMTMYSFQQLLNWSMQQDDDAGRRFFVVDGGKKQSVQAHLSGQDWFSALLNAKHIKGQKGGKIGRDNAMFTIALVLMSEGKEESITHNLLDEYNSSLDAPLKHAAVRKIVKSAYSGRYQGAKKEYIEELLNEYTNQEFQSFKTSSYNKWYKHKKDRSERKRVHLHEWEEDLIKLLEAPETVKSGGFVCYTQKEVCDTLKIPQSTLNKLLNHSSKVLKKASGKGRNARTAFTTVRLLIQYALETSKTNKEAFSTYLKSILTEVVISPAKLIVARYIKMIVNEGKSLNDIEFDVKNTS